MRRLLDSYRDDTIRLKVSFATRQEAGARASVRHSRLRHHGFRERGQSYRITQASEQTVTNAIVRVSREGKKTIHLVTGHGEHSAQDAQRNGYSTAKKVLEDLGYAVKDLLLLRETEVPKDCDVLIVAGPTKPLLDQEREAIQAYLDRGGKVMLLIDPMTQTGLDPLLQQWGVVLHNDVIIDTMSRLVGGSYTTPIMTEYPPTRSPGTSRSPRSCRWRGASTRHNPSPRGDLRAARPNVAAVLGETDLRTRRRHSTPAPTTRGRLPPPPVREEGSLRARRRQGDGPASGVGDSDFADNTYFNFSGNGDLFQNMISYLAKEQDLISIRPKDTKPSPLMLTRAQAVTLFYSAVILAP